MWRIRFRGPFGFLISASLLLFPAAANCHAQTEDVLCREGDGNFNAEFQGGERVHVGAAKSGGFATRSCDATLSWGEQKIVLITAASEVDLDCFGTDLGIELPVAAFQVKKLDSDCCRAYQIYTLQKPPHLLRTLTGASSFRAADTDLDGRVEIWTDDAAAVGGFENFTLSEFDFPPPLVLRFAHNQLLDVSSQFQPYFDRLVAGLRSRLDAADLKDFKESDGKLLPSQTIPPERMHRLRKAKIGILEIVWCYLYSGRDTEAWSALGNFWPGADVERIRTEIVQARNHGIRAQIDGIAPAESQRKKRATIFDATKAEKKEPEVIPPQAILLRRPPPQSLESSVTSAETLLELVVDSGGKVRSVEPAGNTKAVDPALLNAAMGWKFIPAFVGGRAVASRTRLAISGKQ